MHRIFWMKIIILASRLGIFAIQDPEAICNHFRYVTIISFLILIFPMGQFTFDKNLASFFELLFSSLSKGPPRHHIVPFGCGLPFSFFVFVIFIGRN